MSDPTTLGLFSIIVLMLLVAGGVRVFIAAALVGLVGIAILRGWTAAIGLAGLTPHAKAASYEFSVLPMFILIGFFAHASGMVRGAYRAARAWMGWMPGGLTISTVLAAAGFGAVSGASQATAAVFARVAIPELLKFKYNPSLSAAAVAASGTLASLIPPSAAAGRENSIW